MYPSLMRNTGSIAYGVGGDETGRMHVADNS